ncbi:MAG: cyclic nucleotide-binding domain-containing protein, partial [Proteobacteria bacterium]|nr:cyclic nucleotide-binding domain-containing protein [Pseudomonadota bacterium]
MTDGIRGSARKGKINQTIKEARRQRKRLANTAGASTIIMDPLNPALEARIRRLSPINQLPYHYQDHLIRQGDVLSFPRGSRIFREGSEDEYVHYLLEGKVGILVNGSAARHISEHSEASAYSLDEAGKERTATAAVEEPAKVFRIRHAVLARQINLANTAPPPKPDEVLDITEADPSDWIVVTLRDGLFANLPVDTIQRVLARVEEIDVSSGQVILEQGDEADYFYLMKEGSAKVNRKTARNSLSVHLADITAGGGFGEEALIADGKRNAIVTMTSDGVLMKLTREDFNRLIRDPLLRSVSFDRAEQLVAADSVWIDARDEDRFALGALPGAINIPVSLLRLKHRELDRDKTYIVYSDSPSTSAVAAFLLSSRGLQSQYVHEPVYPPLAKPPL